MTADHVKITVHPDGFVSSVRDPRLNSQDVESCKAGPQDGQCQPEWPKETSCVQHKQECSLYAVRTGNRFECSDELAENVANKNAASAELTKIVSDKNNYNSVQVKENEVYFIQDNPKPCVYLNADTSTNSGQGNERELFALVDSGSDRTIIKLEKLKKLNHRAIIKSTTTTVHGLSCIKTPVVGTTSLNFNLKEGEVEVEAIVMENLKIRYDSILGNDLLYAAKANIDYEETTVRLGGQIIPFTFRREDRSAQINLVESQDTIFAGIVRESKNERKKKRKAANKLKRETRIKDYANEHNRALGVSAEINYSGEAEGQDNPRDVTSKQRTKKKRRVDEKNVHVVADITVPQNSFSNILGYAKVTPGEYFLGKSIIKQGLLVAETLVKVGPDRMLQVPVLNTTENEIVVSEGTKIAELASYEKRDIVSVNVICEDIRKELGVRSRNTVDTPADIPQSGQDLGSTRSGQAGRIAGSRERVESVEGGCGDDNSRQSRQRQTVKTETEDETSNSCLFYSCEFQCEKNKSKIKECVRKESVDPARRKLTQHAESTRVNSNSDLVPVGHDEGLTDIGSGVELMELDMSAYHDLLSEHAELLPITMEDRKGKIKLDEIKHLLDPKLPEDYKTKLLEKLNKFRVIMAKKKERTGTTNKMVYDIRLKQPSVIVNVPPYKIPHSYQAQLKEELKILKNTGHIRNSCSPFNAPVLCVKKKDGSVRVVIDYRRLNKELELVTFPLPNIQEMLVSLGEAKIFSTLDLKSAFHQIPLSEESKKYTAFSVNSQKFEYEVLPFGLTTSPAVYQSLMSMVLQDILGVFCFCYIDDIIIHSKTYEDHLKNLDTVFTKLVQANLTLKLEKCKFMVTEVKYLGHKISKDGIQFTDDFAVQNCTTPKDVKSLQSFLGLVNYFRKFIPNFSGIATPLYRLLKVDVPFVWSEDCELAFNKLKLQLNQKTQLAHPDYSLPFILFTDASNYAIGACLAQEDGEGNLRPLAYFSKSLNKTERNYSTTKKEAFALVKALQHFQYVVTGYKIIVCTDHRGLVSIFNKKLPLNTAMARWCLAVQSFMIDVKYYPGTLNIVADYLSRLGEPPTMKTILDSETIATSDNVDHELDDFDVEEGSSVLMTEGDDQEDEIPLVEYIPKLEEVSWTHDELLRAQQEDDHIIDVIEKFQATLKNPQRNISKKELKELDSYMFIGKILYKRRKLHDEDSEVLNVVVPSALMHKAIRAVHYLNHGDVKHTLFKFRFRYYNKYETRSVTRFLESCDLCKILKGKLPKPLTLKKAPLPAKPFDTVAFDLLGPLTRSVDGERYILSIIDVFSRFCILRAISSKDTRVIIHHLNEVFNTFGFPKTLISDNALEFTSSALMQFSTIYSVKKVTVLPYAPFANGIVERNNKKISTLLTLYVNSTQGSEWKEYLSTAQNVINNTLNQTLGETPSYILFNYDTCPNITRELLTHTYNYDCPEHLVKLRERRATQVRDLVSNHLNSTRELQHNQANKKRKDREIKIGSRVIFKNHQKSNKLELAYLGPGVVVKNAGHYVNVKVKDKIFTRIHLNYVIPLKGTNQ